MAKQSGKSKNTGKEKTQFKQGQPKHPKSGRKKGTINKKTALLAVGHALLGSGDIKKLPEAWLQMGAELYKDAQKSWEKKVKIWEVLGKALPKNLDVTSGGEKVNETPAVVQKIYQIPGFKKKDEDSQ